jgi:predicted ATPase/DNA-binding CsgD family transcriptional regulator
MTPRSDPIRPAARIRHGFPAPLTSFVGREREVAELSRLLADTRFVTLTGAGGVGKTRLALAVAASSREDFADGARFVELATLTDQRLLAPAVLSALGAREESNRSPLDTLVDLLRPRRLLLVLDNCEHLAVACADLATALLGDCPELRILATSRHVLQVPGEVDWRVPPLTLPPNGQPPSPERLAEVEAVRLFLDRARAAAPDFSLTERNAAAVGRICRQLDGMPLAIELAAAWVKTLSAEQIAERVDGSVSLLTRGSRVAAPRHQTLRATMDWSYALLSGPERELLARLAIFPGGWTLEAAETVASEDGDGRRTGDEGRRMDPASLRPSSSVLRPSSVLDLLAALVDKSLVAVVELQGASRYRFLEPVRQYAREKLRASGQELELAARHRAWLVDLAERAGIEWRGELQTTWLERLDAELDNVRAALDTSSLGPDQLEPALRLAGALWWFWLVRGHLREGRVWLAALLARDEPVGPAVQARALSTTGRLALVQGDYPSARAALEAALTIWRQLGRSADVADALNDLGQCAHGEGDPDRARSRLEESLALARSLDDEVRGYVALDHLGEVAQDVGDVGRAAELYQAALEIQRRLGHRRGMAVSLTNLGSLAQRRGDHRQADTLYREGLALLVELGDRRRTAACLEGLAAAASARGQAQRAARLFGAAEGLRERAGVTLPPPHRAAHQPHVESARARLDPDTFRAAWAAGRAMPLDEAVAYALETPVPTQIAAGDTPAPGQLALSPREREVAALIARGLTNRQIADELMITEGTAANHVKHILAKLTLDSRVQIAAWAIEHGLHKPFPS